MKSALHFANSASSSRETSPAAPPPFDAMPAWNTEVLAASDRCLTRVLDHMAAAQRATGWPDRVSASTRDCILKAPKLRDAILGLPRDNTLRHAYLRKRWSFTACE
ncbi:MAG: hypothetical protein AB7O44_08550 [Hyphomicrobiaceae bacterium]